MCMCVPANMTHSVTTKSSLKKQSIFVDFARLSLGDQHSIIVKLDGSVWSTGDNKYGQLGTGATVDSYTFVWSFTNDATAVAAGSFHSVVLKQDGSVWAAGV